MSDTRLAGMPRIWGRVPTTTTQLRQRTWPFWILMAVTAAGVVGFAIVLVQMIAAGGQVGPALVSLLAWAVWTAVLFGLVCLLDVYRHVPPSVRFTLVLWGAGVAALIGKFLEDLLDPVLGKAADALATGVIEEGAKLLGVIVIAALVPVLFRRPMGGLISGMMVGLGFSIMENLEYAVQATSSGQGASDPYSAVTTTVLQRGFTEGAGLHLVLTGLTSLGVAYFVAHRASSPSRRWIGALAFVIGAVVFHFLWDWGASLQGTVSAAIVITLNVLHFVIVALMIIYAVRSERRWLSNATTDARPVIEPAERRSLRKHGSRRRARGTADGPQHRQRTKTRQWAQIGYVDALADGAPESETDRLASYVASLREAPTGTVGTGGPGDVPSQRRAAPSEQPHPTTESSN